MNPAERPAFNPAERLREPARVLIVHASAEVRTALKQLVDRAGHLSLVLASLDGVGGLADVRDADVCLVGDDDVTLPRVSEARAIMPNAPIVLLAGSTQFDSAVQAMRLGVFDVITENDDDQTCRRIIERALDRRRSDLQREARMIRLKDVCRKLNAARHEVGERVRNLSDDLACVYRDIDQQLSDVALATEFRTLLGQELELEELLRTALEYVLTKTGPTNAAVFLPDQEGGYGLGAYVNYSCPRESADVLLSHLCDVVCPHFKNEEDIVIYEDAAELAEWLGGASTFLKDSGVVAFACRHADETYAVVVLFREEQVPFTDQILSMLDTLRPIFARQVASILKVHHRASASWPREVADDAGECDDDFGFPGGLAA